MSMNPDPQDFEALRRLIALKRHERPHPRFFNDFSTVVIARIQAGELERQEGSGLLSLMPSWVLRLWAAFETKPMWAGVAGLGACALVVAGFVISENAGSASPDIPPVPGGTGALMAEHPVTAPIPEHPATLVSFGSMNGVPTSQPEGSLFQQFRNAQRQTWQFTSAPGN
jgi:hypothetical protein